MAGPSGTPGLGNGLGTQDDIDLINQAAQARHELSKAIQKANLQKAADEASEQLTR